MVKAKRLLAMSVQRAPVVAGRFEQLIGADDIGVDKSSRAGNRAIHMAFGRKVHHCIGLVECKQCIEGCAIANIGMLEAVAWTVFNAL